MTDRVSRYMVELLPYLREQYHISILDQYYKVTAEFERLGDHASNIAENAQSLSEKGTSYSDEALGELKVMEDLLDEILSCTEQAFAKRDVRAAENIEPLVQLTEEISAIMKKHHLKRMSNGSCNIYADASFTNLLVDLGRIADVCSNVGIATIVRVRPELADHEHSYFHSLHAGQNEAYNKSYEAAYSQYVERLKAPDPEPAVVEEETVEVAEESSKGKKKKDKEKSKEKEKKKKK